MLPDPLLDKKPVPKKYQKIKARMIFWSSSAMMMIIIIVSMMIVIIFNDDVFMMTLHIHTRHISFVLPPPGSVRDQQISAMIFSMSSFHHVHMIDCIEQSCVSVLRMSCAMCMGVQTMNSPSTIQRVKACTRTEKDNDAIYLATGTTQTV